MQMENLLNARRRKLFLLLVIGIMACSTYLNALNYPSKTRTFKGTAEQVFNTAVKVAQLHWHVTFLDRETKTLSFDETTTVDIACSVVVEDLQDGSVRVTLGMQGRGLANTMQRLEASDATASTFFDGIEDELSKQAKRSH